MKNKKGILGLLPAWLLATLFIVVILLIFFISSSVIREVEGSQANLKIYDEAETKIENVAYYFEYNYSNLTRIRLWTKTKEATIKEIIKEVNYEK